MVFFSAIASGSFEIETSATQQQQQKYIQKGGERKEEEMRKERPIMNNPRNRITRLANSKHLGKESDLL